MPVKEPDRYRVWCGVIRIVTSAVNALAQLLDALRHLH
jgi:hypothetical protein